MLIVGVEISILPRAKAAADTVAQQRDLTRVDLDAARTVDELAEPFELLRIEAFKFHEKNVFRC